MTKIPGGEIHFKKRLRERYGIQMSDKEIEDVIQSIKDGKYGDLAKGDTYLKKLNPRGKRYIVKINFKDKNIWVLFCHSTSRLVTAIKESDIGNYLFRGLKFKPKRRCSNSK